MPITQDQRIQEGAAAVSNPDLLKVRLKRLSGRGAPRQQVKLTKEQRDAIKLILSNIWEEWMANTSLLKSKLLRYNNVMEGIKTPKDFPWKNSSNLHIPLIEIHITILHSVASATMLEMDPIWYVKPIQDGIAEDVDTDIEKFLHAKSKIEMKVDQVLSDIYWNTYRDGTGCGALDWVEEYEKVYDNRTYVTVEDFQKDYPDPETAGIEKDEYMEYVRDLKKGEDVNLLEEQLVASYAAPRLRIVELKDLVVIPATSPSFEYAMFVGDAFTERNDYFNRMAKNEGWFDADEVDLVVEYGGLTGAPDSVSQSQDQIEGIGRSRITTPDEKHCLQGILKYDLDDDGIEEKFLVVFHPKTKALLRFERFPYWHNRCNYIPWRFKKRPKRLLGQSIPDQLIDINDEVDTQHNQRIDSRTITLVPSFLKLDTADFDTSRRDQGFYPGVTFRVANFNTFKQLEIKQTDMGQSMQEESNDFQIADQRTGASQLRSGTQTKQDPRSPAKKVALLLQQSGSRIDDHMRELRYGTEEVGYQILELYYQFSPDSISYPKFNPDTQTFVKAQIARAKLRNRNMLLQVARTSIMDNPSQAVQRLMTIWQVALKEPLIAGNVQRRREVVYRLFTALRERDVEKIIPKADQLLKEIEAQSGAAGVQNLMENIGAVKPAEPAPGDKDQGAAKPMDTTGDTIVGEG